MGIKPNHSKYLRSHRYEGLIFLIVFFGIFGSVGHQMGVANMLNTIMNTAWSLLMNTVFYIMGVTVLSGALGKLMIEFGVVRLLEKVLSPFMRPIFNLPGVASLASLMTFFSDNPAVLSLSNDYNFNKYFRKYELLSLTNFGTAFGMGLIVMTFMTGLGYFAPALTGLLGAAAGAVVATRLMQYFIKDHLPKEEQEPEGGQSENIRFQSHGSLFLRLLNAVLDGGKQGVSLGLAIIPGVLVLSTFIMLFTYGPKDVHLGYKGLAYEGVPVLPKIGSYFQWLFRPLFGFNSPELIAFPITSLGAVGAALSLVKDFMAKNIITGNEIAVFTGMGMCWSGFLSTHAAMLDALGYRQFTSKSIIAQTSGGIIAGIVAHYAYLMFSSLGCV